MKYFHIKGINRAISLIREGNNNQEHVTSRATFAMINHYFKQEDNWFTTPEQIQIGSKKRPDYVIEKHLDKDPFFKPHAFVEVKSLIGQKIENILDQLYDTVLFTIDYHGGSFSCFMIAMKVTKIAFYTYHNFISLLDEYHIPHYKGFIPLNYILPISLYSRINRDATPQMYENYVNSHSSITTDANVLHNLGAIKTNGLSHPHILDLVNDKHKEDIHSMWKFVLEQSSNIILD